LISRGGVNLKPPPPLRTPLVQALLEAEAIGVEVEAVDEIAASTSLVLIIEIGDESEA